MKIHRRRLVQVAFGMALVLCGACATTSKNSGAPNYSSQQLRDVGERFLIAGDTAQALRLLVSAEQKDPNDPQIQYDLGLAYNTRGLADKAMEHFQRALTLKPDYTEVYNAMGTIYADQNRLDEAQRAFERAIADPFYTTPHYPLYNLGRVYEKRGDTRKALAQYQEAARLQPSYAPAHYQMGRMLEKLNRTEEARNAYGRAIQFNADLAEAHFDFARLSVMIGDNESAVGSFERVIKLDPRSNLASESRKYLDRIKPQVAKRSAATRSSHRVSSSQALEEISHLQTEIERKRSYTPATESSVEAPSSRPAVDTAAQPPQRVAASPGKWSYVIRVSSFREQQNAESLREKLAAKGYDVVVKTFPGGAAGPFYAVQLRPMSDVNQVNALAERIEREEQSKPMIFKLRPGSENTFSVKQQPIQAPPGSIIIRPSPEGISESVVPESPAGIDAASAGEAAPAASPAEKQIDPPLSEQPPSAGRSPEAGAPGAKAPVAEAATSADSNKPTESNQ